MSNSDQDPSTSKDISKSELPIAVCKGHRSMARYPLANFISFDGLSHSLHTFSLSLSVMSLPKDYKEALAVGGWP